jgi:hypothetical protein
VETSLRSCSTWVVNLLISASLVSLDCNGLRRSGSSEVCAEGVVNTDAARATA